MLGSKGKYKDGSAENTTKKLNCEHRLRIGRGDLVLSVESKHCG